MSFYRFILIFVIVSLFFSCKRGCTDPFAYNYKPNKTVDNGKCKFYDIVYVDSLRINRLPSVNTIGNSWDGGDSLDFDNNNSYPDIHIQVNTPSGYYIIGDEFWSDVNPFSSNLFAYYGDKISSSGWEENSFTFYIFEWDLDFSMQLIDSIVINPFKQEERNRKHRFLEEVNLDYNNDGIGMDFYFHWEE